MQDTCKETEWKHCDEFIRDKSQPKCLRAFLLFKRVPAYWGSKWEFEKKWPVPVLFATRPAHRGPGGGKKKAQRVRVTMASRFGDVGITKDLTRTHGYEDRVYVEELTDFSETP